MSVTDRIPERKRPKLLIAVMAFCAVGACLNFIGLGVALNRIGDQASEGNKARITQCRTFPVALKLYKAAERYHLITPADLATYRAAAPSSCPPKNS